MPERLLTSRPPKQERSRASLARMLEAAASLLEEEGYEGFTVAEVARSSGLSTGSIYTRFDGKDALVHAVHARLMDRIREESYDLSPLAGDDVPTAELIRRAVARLAETWEAHGKLLRVFTHRGAVDEVIAARAARDSSDLADAFRALLLERRAELTHPEPELGVDVSYRMAFSTFARRVMYGPVFESRYRMTWQELVDQVVRAVTLFLLGTVPARRARAQRPRARRPSSPGDRGGEAEDADRGSGARQPRAMEVGA